MPNCWVTYLLSMLALLREGNIPWEECECNVLDNFEGPLVSTRKLSQKCSPSFDELWFLLCLYFLILYIHKLDELPFIKCLIEGSLFLEGSQRPISRSKSFISLSSCTWLVGQYRCPIPFMYPTQRLSWSSWRQRVRKWCLFTRYYWLFKFSVLLGSSWAPSSVRLFDSVNCWSPVETLLWRVSEKFEWYLFKTIFVLLLIGFGVIMVELVADFIVPLKDLFVLTLLMRSWILKLELLLFDNVKSYITKIFKFMV